MLLALIGPLLTFQVFKWVRTNERVKFGTAAANDDDVTPGPDDENMDEDDDEVGDEEGDEGEGEDGEDNADEDGEDGDLNNGEEEAPATSKPPAAPAAPAAPVIPAPAATPTSLADSAIPSAETTLGAKPETAGPIEPAHELPSNAIELSNSAPGHTEDGSGDLGEGGTMEVTRPEAAEKEEMEVDEPVEQVEAGPYETSAQAEAALQETESGAGEPEVDERDPGLVMGEMEAPEKELEVVGEEKQPPEVEL